MLRSQIREQEQLLASLRGGFLLTDSGAGIQRKIKRLQDALHKLATPGERCTCELHIRCELHLRWLPERRWVRVKGATLTDGAPYKTHCPTLRQHPVSESRLWCEHAVHCSLRPV